MKYPISFFPYINLYTLLLHKTYKNDSSYYGNVNRRQAVKSRLVEVFFLRAILVDLIGKLGPGD